MTHTERDEAVCDHCNEPLTDANESPVAGLCAPCLDECPCWDCRETRREIAEDHAADRAVMAAKEEL